MIYVLDSLGLGDDGSLWPVLRVCPTMLPAERYDDDGRNEQYGIPTRVLRRVISRIVIYHIVSTIVIINHSLMRSMPDHKFQTQ